MEKSLNKLLYFAKIGEYCEVDENEYKRIIGKLLGNEYRGRKRKFKYEKVNDKHFIWRIK